MINKLMNKYEDFFIEDAHFDPIAKGVLVGFTAFVVTLTAIIAVHALLM